MCLTVQYWYPCLSLELSTATKDGLRQHDSTLVSSPAVVLTRQTAANLEMSIQPGGGERAQQCQSTEQPHLLCEANDSSMKMVLRFEVSKPSGDSCLRHVYAAETRLPALPSMRACSFKHDAVISGRDTLLCAQRLCTAIVKHCKGSDCHSAALRLNATCIESLSNVCPHGISAWSCPVPLTHMLGPKDTGYVTSMFIGCTYTCVT